MTQRKYKHIWRQKRPLIEAEAHIKQYLEQRDILGSTHSYSFLYAKEYIVEELHRRTDNYEWIKLGEKLLRKSFFLDLLKKGERLRHCFAQFVSELNNRNLARASDDAITELFKKAYVYHSRFRGLFKTTREEFLTCAEIRLKKMLSSRIDNKENLQTAFELLTTPSELDDIALERLEWENILSKNRQFSENSTLRHLAKYPWLIAHSSDYYQILYQTCLKFYNGRGAVSALQDEIKKLKTRAQKLRAAQNDYLRQFDNQEITYLSWLFQEASIERMRLKGGWAGSGFLYLPLYEEISKRTGVSVHELNWSYRLKEVVTAIKEHSALVTNEEKINRQKAYIFLLNKRKLSFLSGESANKIIQGELSEIEEGCGNAATLRGQIASLGQAQGRVRVIVPGDIAMLAEDMNKFQTGEILVTTMTQPNMISLMKKSAGIITDEGGLTSHAAIIAREFKIPCIVGTEIATKVLKDGDIVEVDAIKGVARKIA